MAVRRLPFRASPEFCQCLPDGRIRQSKPVFSHQPGIVRADLQGLLADLQGGVELTAKLDKLTLRIDRPVLSEEGKAKLEAAMKAGSDN